MTGLTAGTIAIRNNCLMLIAKTGPAILPVFPDGMAQWDDGSGALTVNGRTHRLGERLELGGGSMPKAMRPSAGLAGAIARCQPDEVFLVAG